MSLRVISGKWRGKTLMMPEKGTTRPTTDRARESLFNILENAKWRDRWHGLNGMRMLDAFCGSGAVGIEALSRGASHVTFCDQDAGALSITRLNLDDLKTDAGQFDIWRGDASKLSPPDAPYDMVFLDPPYGYAKFPELLSGFLQQGMIDASTLIVIESEKTPPELPEDRFHTLDTRRYGRVCFTFKVAPSRK